MEWTDDGIVLGVRRHGETSAIVELLTREHGRHLGLVRGGAGSRMRPLLQPGNSVQRGLAGAARRASRHLRDRGHAAARGDACWHRPHAVYGVTHLAALARLLPERDPHEDIFEMLDHTLDDFDDAGGAAVHLVRFELAMLGELGFGLDLESCAATGETTDLVYVSPKSGGAVSRAGGRTLARPAVAAAAVPAPSEEPRGDHGLVGSGPAGRLPAHRHVPAAPCAGTARAGPFRCARRLHQCGDPAAR